MGKTLEEIDEMPYSEFLDWYEYSLIEPFNTNEIMLAQLTALIFNSKAKKSKQKKLIEFMLSISDEDIKLSKQKTMEQNLMADL